MESLSLSKLNLYIRRVITLNFQDPIWVSAEILSLKEKNGHTYLELTEKDADNNIAAQNSAIIWKTAFANIIKSAKFNSEDILREGNEVRLLVAVDFSVRYGLKLIVQNIDSEYTYGKIAQARLLTIGKLKQQGVWQKNKFCSMPVVIQNIAVISSIDSAGFKDFENHLKENQFNYTFKTSTFNVSVQGINSVPEICKAFERIKKKNWNFDVVVLIRGGGSKHDLLEFDAYDIAMEISNCKIPVLTGIGHFIDESIADLSAHQSLKTPTAVADFILSKNREYELKVLNELQSVITISKQRIANLAFGISEIRNVVLNRARVMTYNQQNKLSELSYGFRRIASGANHDKFKKLADLNIVIETNDPDAILRKGYSLTYKGNTLISKCESIAEGDEIRTVLYNGYLTSKVNKIWEPKK